MAKITKKKDFRKRSGFQVKGDVHKIGKRLKKLTGKKGVITPEQVVEDAQNPKSPLHDEFEWDDTEAAYKYRLDQARYLFRAIESVWVEEETEMTVRSFVSIEEDLETPYRDGRVVLSDVELRAQWKAQALRELRSWRNRYNNIKELVEVFAAADTVL
jgi:hypothetical protein